MEITSNLVQAIDQPIPTKPIGKVSTEISLRKVSGMTHILPISISATNKRKDHDNTAP